MVLLTHFDHVEESFSYEEVQVKNVSSPVKTSYSPAENVYFMKPLTSALIFMTTTELLNMAAILQIIG